MTPPVCPIQGRRTQVLCVKVEVLGVTGRERSRLKPPGVVRLPRPPAQHCWEHQSGSSGAVGDAGRAPRSASETQV